MDEGESGRPSIVIATVKSVVVVGVMSWLAAGWLSTSVKDNETLTRLAGNISRGVDDPLTTGSIAGRGDSTKLDPCSTRPRR